MEEQVVIEVTSAIVIEGLVVPPGQTVEVLASDARMLIAQGKAVRVENSKQDTESANNAEPEESASETAAPKARTGKAR